MRRYAVAAVMVSALLAMLGAAHIAANAQVKSEREKCGR